MNRNQLLDDINVIFRDAFMDDDLIIKEETTANDVEDWDSLMQITLITAIESKYGIEFTLDDTLKMKNVGDMMDAILQKVNE